MAGGRSNGRGCGGGAGAESCFQVRMMWRRDGDGEAYIYAPDKQSSDFCTKYPRCGGWSGPIPCNFCDGRTGTSFGRGTFRFKRGEWQRISVTVVLNDPGKANGYLEVLVDGKKVISYDTMIWRNKSNVKIEALSFSSWFGGSDASWSPPKDTYLLLKNMKAYRTGAPTLTQKGRSAAIDVLDMPTEANVVYEEIEEPMEYDEGY